MKFKSYDAYLRHYFPGLIEAEEEKLAKQDPATYGKYIAQKSIEKVTKVLKTIKIV